MRIAGNRDKDIMTCLIFTTGQAYFKPWSHVVRMGEDRILLGSSWFKWKGTKPVGTPSVGG